MSNFSYDYKGYPILLYNNEGESLTRTTITDYDKINKFITLNKIPPGLNIGDTCKLLILIDPVPREYQGVIKNDASNTVIALFKGQDKNNRTATRYKVDFTAFIEKLIYDNQTYSLFRPVEVNLLNISTGGMRFYAKPNTITDGDIFQTRIYINLEIKTLTAKVMNSREVSPGIVEYGCMFVRK